MSHYSCCPESTSSLSSCRIYQWAHNCCDHPKSNQTDCLYKFRGEQLTDLDLEILHLGEDDHTLPSAHCPKSSKRTRDTIERESNYDLVQYTNDADAESDADFEQVPKKRNRSDLRTPNVEARHLALQQLKSRRSSRGDHKSAGDEARSSKTHGKTQKPKKKQKKRRPQVNELVTLTEPAGNPHIELDSSEFHNSYSRPATDNLALLQADEQNCLKIQFLSKRTSVIQIQAAESSIILASALRSMYMLASVLGRSISLYFACQGMRVLPRQRIATHWYIPVLMGSKGQRRPPSVSICPRSILLADESRTRR